MQLLHIDSSILGDHSVSRQLTADIVARETALHPGIQVTYHDLANAAALHLSGAHLAAWQGGNVEDPTLKADLATGNAYMDELFAADIIVIGAPMYNFSIPSQLKAWIDRIAVAGKTFRYGANGPEGLLSPAKKVFIVASRGGVYSAGSPAAALEHQNSYLADVLRFLGVTDITVVYAEGLAMGQEAKDAAIGQARKEIAAIAA